MKSDRIIARQAASTGLAACGIYQIALGLYFMAFRPSLLPEDLRYIGSSAVNIRSSAAGLEPWLQWVLAVMGGQMLGVGVVILLATARLRKLGGASITEIAFLAVVAGASVGLMSTVNFAIGSEFRWALLIPVALWVAVLVLLALGRKQ